MLQRGKDSPLIMHGFLIGVQLVDDVITPEEVARKLADSLSWVEGIGEVDVESLGKIDVVNEDISE